LTRKNYELSPIAPVDVEYSAAEILEDYYWCCLSREISMLARREVLSGRAKFATTDDGKELLQVAMAKVFQPGDFRADYYRGHTLMLVLGLAAPEDIFAQLYADAERDPFSKGRQMVNHHATALVDERGAWLPHRDHYNISSDISPTAGHLPRALGLAYASKKYREVEALRDSFFSSAGNEVCFCNIGDASTSEGVFWETLNAAAVVGAPLVVSVWDDGYGISVPVEYQTVKSSISKALAGFQSNEEGEGLDIHVAEGWNYPALCRVYRDVVKKTRATHRPALVHVRELTQPQGHSTSGSHERYKSPERLRWEKEHDANRQFRAWIARQGAADESQLLEVEKRARQEAKAARDRAWSAYTRPIQAESARLREMLSPLVSAFPDIAGEWPARLAALRQPAESDLTRLARQAVFALEGREHAAATALRQWLSERRTRAQQRYGRDLYSESERSAPRVPEVSPRYAPDAPLLNGYEIIHAFFDKAFEKYPNLFAFGEDLGRIGGVNQGMAGLQAKYGESRIFDTGIREWTIIGQAIGMAMRGLRPIAEIQYLDYLIYALPALSDDLATLRYRSGGQQIAPVIIRTRGHRLEGIWHSGSPMGMIIHALRGIHILTPRNFTQAAGMYNTLLQGDDPALLVECLNAYRLKERLPANIGEYTVPLGIPEILQTGEDLSIVTYGACVREAQKALPALAVKGISAELIDARTLLPFDRERRIAASLRKTNRLLVVDEDVPGGASAFILREILETQYGYRYLDSPPRTLCAWENRSPYGSDGDYYCKPNAEDICEAAYQLVFEANPRRFGG
jgi:pyruvate/2-oxoglutarate/acetoin dehydrogenase E1 component/TPP-dependent pyruvate/acetoin dehydrogenase alpha subunit